MQKIKDGVVTYNEDGKTLKKQDSRIHLCTEGRGHTLEISLPDLESGKHQSVFIPLNKLIRELNL